MPRRWRSCDPRPSSRSAECSLLHQWGDEQFVLGRYDAAFRTITEAAACFEEVGDSSRLGRAYVSLGRVYRAHGRLDLALEQYTHALELQQAAGDRLAAVQSLNAIAVTYGYMGRYDEALARLNEALDLARAIRSDRNVDFLRGNIAGIYNTLGRYQEAAAALEETLASPISENRIQRLTQLTNAYVGLGLKTRALETAEQAVALSKGLPPDEMAMVLSARAWALQALGRFEAATTDLQGALAAVEDLRVHTVADDFLKRGFGQRYQWVFASSISLLQAQGRTREAIETAERARARAFLDLLASRQRASEPAERTPTSATWRGAGDVLPDGRGGRAPSLDGRRLLGERHRDVRLGGEPRRPARVGAHRGDRRRARLDGAGRDRQRPGPGRPPRWSRPRRAALARALSAAARSGARSICRRRPAAGSPSFRTGRCSGCRSPRSATRPIAISSRPTTSTTFPRSGRCPSRRCAAAPRRSTSALLVGDPSPDAVRDRVLALPALPWAGREVEASPDCCGTRADGADRSGRHGGTVCARASRANRCSISPRTESSRTRSACPRISRLPAEARRRGNPRRRDDRRPSDRG